MATPFAHTLRSLEVDAASGRRLLTVIAPLLLAAWTAWLFLARVELREVSADARVEVDAVSREFSAARAGRVSRLHVDLGDRVEAGALLVELDDREAALALAHARERLTSLGAVIAERRREVGAERAALETAERAAGAAKDEARARVDAALAEARLAESRLAESLTLEQAAVVSRAELRRNEAEAERLRATTRERRSASSFTRYDGERRLRDRLARIVTVEAEIAALEVERSDARGRVAALEAELEDHRIRAPEAGVVGELAPIERGAWVDPGEILGVIVPEGELVIVARFAPSQALGRIKAGQPATLRLAGFPWAEYGSVQARVRAVAREPRSGKVAVELAIESVPATITLEHGLPGSVEVEIEETSPARLLLRAAGHKLTSPSEVERRPSANPPPAQAAETSK